MSKSAWTLVFVCLAAIGAIAIAGFRLANREPPAQTVKLGDGALVRLEAVTYGKQHHLLKKSAWQRALGPILPMALKGRTLSSTTTNSDTLICWLSRSPMVVSENWKGRAAPFDEHGCRIGMGVAYGGFRNEISPGRVVTSAPLNAFPRREGHFRLRLYEVSNGTPAAQLRLTNPVQRAHPAWSPEPVPITRKQNDLHITLTALTTGLEWRRVVQSQPAPPAWEREAAIRNRASLRGQDPSVPSLQEIPWNRASFQLREGGRPSQDWTLEDIVVSDATGNSLEPDAGLVFSDAYGRLKSPRDREGRLWFAFQGSLCPREVWKLRARLAYAGPSDPRRADLLWTVPGVRVPGEGQIASVNAEKSWQGVTLRVVELLGRGAPLPDRPGEKIRQPTVRLAISQPSDARLTLMLQARDDRGRTTISAYRGRMSADDREWWPALPITPGTKTVALTVAVWKDRTFEYLVQPSPAIE